jgi:hypothetical protein
LVVSANHLDRLSLHFAAEIRPCHLRRDQRAGAGSVGIKAVHIGQHADLDDVVRDLRLRDARGSPAREYG